MSDGGHAPQLQPLERRTFLRFSGVTAGLGAFGAGVLGFLWPTLGEGFGATFDLGPAADILATVRADQAPLVHPSRSPVRGRVRPEPAGRRRGLRRRGGPAGRPRRTHGAPPHVSASRLSCAVVPDSQWFECPCHGSKCNRYGEWVGGPAPRGLDRFPTGVTDGVLQVDTGSLVPGRARTIRVLNQEAAGPNCVDL